MNEKETEQQERERYRRERMQERREEMRCMAGIAIMAAMTSSGNVHDYAKIAERAVQAADAVVNKLLGTP